jgi:hypothetical protein
MIDAAEKRGQIIRHLEDALALADEIEDGTTGFLMERALDEARSQTVQAGSLFMTRLLLSALRHCARQESSSQVCFRNRLLRTTD